MMQARDIVTGHFAGLVHTVGEAYRHAGILASWATELASRLQSGQQVLVAGNGGSAAEAEHFTAELVGRYQKERPPFAALALTAETSALTALGNDYGFDEVFARQVRAYGKPGDILLLLSTSGESANLIAAARVAEQQGLTTWAFTGERPNSLADACSEAVCFQGRPPHVQECHLIAIHAICEVFDAIVRDSTEKGAENE